MVHNKPHIGIIGAGASGLVTAWLLEQDYKVTLFEKENYVGGHVSTVPITIAGKEWHIEAGAEFFSDMMFPEFNKLLAILKVPVRQYPLTYTFYNTVSNHTLVLPPIQEGHILWRSCTPAHWFDLIHFKQFVDHGSSLVALEDQSITLKEYVDEIGLPTAFNHHFLYPFFAASWGVTAEDIQQFAAYDIIKWVLLNKPANLRSAHWKEIPGGLHTYIKALVSQLTNTHIITNNAVQSVEYNGNHYRVIDAQGNQHQFDHLVCATNAQTTAQFLNRIPQTENFKKTLENIEYFTAHIAIHGDKRLLPQNPADWSAANIAYNNYHSALTIAKPWMQEISVFRSWITYNVWNDAPTIFPEPLYATRTYHHPKVTLAYFQTQKRLRQLQGNNNLWIAGFYTHDTDSHNSAIVSAINIAKKLNPKSLRLAQLIS